MTDSGEELSEDARQLKIYVLQRSAASSSLYTSWLASCPFATTIVDEYLPDWIPPDDVGLIVTHDHYRWESLACLRQVFQQQRIPILILCDGILEYRNTWQHQDLPDGSLFQPSLGNKLACLGRGQARHLETWGNTGKCEVVGLPRLDDWISRQVAPPQLTGPFRLLVATSNQVAFDERQRAVVVQALRALQCHFQQGAEVGGRAVEICWRLRDGMHTELGIKEDHPVDRQPLWQVLQQVDAVITTPSTVFLESLLLERPTALLDFQNCPQYVPSAWTITCQSQIESVVSELADPPRAKMLFQAEVLRDQLECQTPALPRMLELIQCMVLAGLEARQQNRRLQLPDRILAASARENSTAPSLNLAELYPGNLAFRHDDGRHLQIELSAALSRLGSLPLELADKNRHIAQLKKTISRLALRNQELHQRVTSLREGLQERGQR